MFPPLARKRLIPAHAGKTGARRSPVSASGAHPRSRGENSFTRVKVALCGGSSPLTRGKPNRGYFARRHPRLIPAHAGKTEDLCSSQTHTPAHPRSRGENQVLGTAGGGVAGSSPLTRGKPYAGEQPALSRLAHPRSRGENLQPHQDHFEVQGSSPLTRGKPYAPTSWWAGERLIPAHAGKTRTAHAVRVSAMAHPRSRGENGLILPKRDAALGSSPLTRGKRPQRRHEREPHRLIPAHAGKTLSPPSWLASRPAHPRSRGENAWRLRTSQGRGGSSPLTRGKQGAPANHAHHGRLIPAHAGKTL